MEYKLRRPIVIFSDMDGCISPKQKIWYEEPQEIRAQRYLSGELGPLLIPRDRQLKVMKPICDYDSGTISLIRKLKQVELVFISGDDKINKLYAERQSIPFISTGAVKHSDKWEHLVEYWEENYSGEPNGRYVYIGDSMPDFHCLMRSGIGFTPHSCSKLLRMGLETEGVSDQGNPAYPPHIHRLMSKGGDGVLEEVLVNLIEMGKIQKRSVLKRLGVR